MMKTKYLLNSMLFLALCTCAFTACNKKGDVDATQYTIDTMVNNKVQKIVDQLNAQCDSSVMQAARLKADSILKAKGK